MPKKLRFQPQKDMIHVVSMRCLQGFTFLKPNPRLNQIIAGVLSRAYSTFEEDIDLRNRVLQSGCSITVSLIQIVRIHPLNLVAM